MILDKHYLYWIYVIPSNRPFRKSPFTYKGKALTKKEYIEHWGKWVVMDEKENLDKLALSLESYVEKRAIYSIKYSRTNEEIFDIDSCVMCVFCDDREKNDVWNILSAKGVTLKAWVYDRDVIKMWQPGGFMLEKWLDKFSVTGKEAEEIRKSTQKKYDKWLSSIETDSSTDPWSFELLC